MKIGLDARTMFVPRPRGTGRNLRDAFALIPELRPEWEFVLYHQREGIEEAAESAERRPVGDRSPDVGDRSPDVADRSPDAGARLSGDRSLTGLAGVPTGGRSLTGLAEGRSPTGFSAPPPSNVTARRIDIPGDRFDAWLNLRLPWAARRDSVDLLHFPANAAPAYCPAPFVVTIHDLIPLRVEGECSPERRRRFERGVRRAVRGAAHIITPSEATRGDLIEQYGVADGRVTVIPWAADREVVARWRSWEGAHSLSAAGADRGRHPAAAAARSRYGLERDYWIGFSGESPRKNAGGLVEAMGELARSHPAADIDLVLVGCEPADFRARLAELAGRAGVAHRCRFPGFVPHEDIAGLLGGARGLVMPSLCEGFGLPILDAFALGVPVLTSGFGSMAEVAGDAAVYCDPRDPKSIAGGMAELMDDATAKRIARRGAVRERAFTWRRTAEAMCEVYEACLAWRPARLRDRAEVMPV